jgi:hypothetical protein
MAEVTQTNPAARTTAANINAVTVVIVKLLKGI